MKLFQNDLQFFEASYIILSMLDIMSSRSTRDGANTYKTSIFYELKFVSREVIAVYIAEKEKSIKSSILRY